MRRPVLYLLLSAAALFTVLSASAAAPDTGQGGYTAKLEIKAFKNEKTGRSPQLPFSGTFAHSGGKFRMEVVNDLTTEKQVIILDSSTKKAWMLFPDTLNGITADLASFDKKGLATSAQGFLGGNLKSVPKDWAKPQSKSETLNGTAVTHLTYALPQVTGASGKKVPGGTVHLYHKADNTPVKVVVDSPSVKLTVDFSNVKRGGTVDSSLFTPGKNYKLRALGKGELPPLPGGIPGTALDA